MLGHPLSFTAAGTRAQNREGPAATGPLIVAFGDSMTEGYAVGDDETWPAALERLTHRPVLNAGVRGYDLDQMVLRAERLVPELNPSTVVLAFIADDISRTALAVRDFRSKPYFIPDGEDWHCTTYRCRRQASRLRWRGCATCSAIRICSTGS